MSDYISRDELIEKIRYEGIYGSGYSDKEREDDVVDMIESIPAADVKPVRWIPVTEQFPEENQLVIGFTPVDGYMFVGYYFSYKRGSKTEIKWRIITSMRSTKDITKKVTHWMPLPEPPNCGAKMEE